MKVTKVHFAGLILGKIYVAVRFENGVDRHYWLQEPGKWQPSTVYQPGDLVQPSAPDGFYYEAASTSQAPVWAAGQSKSIGDVVQPTASNGYEYVATDVSGTPVTGTTEPAWPTSEGAIVFEGTDSTTVPSTDSSTSATSQQDSISSAIKDRYGLGDDA